MTHKVDMILDLQYGSTGKGLIAGYLAKRGDYDLVACAFAPNAGHTYVDKSQGLHVMTQQLPTAAIVSKTVKHVLLGPGSLISALTLKAELLMYSKHLAGKRVMIHPQAAVVEPWHIDREIESGMTKIGSTAKGVGAAMAERIRRDPQNPNTVYHRLKLREHPILGKLVVTEDEYREVLNGSENVLIEGAQGYSLSLYHGQYPYTTSRDVTPWQVAADCGLPYRWASYIQIVGTMRTFPIRVNNRDGTSGPCYVDQRELEWGHFESMGIAPELTTVTKLKRRIFTFSRQQAMEALFHCGGYWDTRIFLNFANYCAGASQLAEIIRSIEAPCSLNQNPARVAWTGWGADDGDVRVHGNKPLEEKDLFAAQA